MSYITEATICFLTNKTCVRPDLLPMCL